MFVVRGIPDHTGTNYFSVYDFEPFLKKLILKRNIPTTVNAQNVEWLVSFPTCAVVGFAGSTVLKALWDE